MQKEPLLVFRLKKQGIKSNFVCRNLRMLYKLNPESF